MEPEARGSGSAASRAPDPERRARLAELAARIRALETGAGASIGSDRPAPAPAELLADLERGVLHELCGPGDGADWSAPLALLVALCHAALADDDAHTQVAFVGRRVWPHAAALVTPPRLVRHVGRHVGAHVGAHAGPHVDSALVLARFGEGPADPRLGTAALFVDTRSVVAPGQRGANAATGGLGAHVWAADRVLRARVAAAVVVDGSGLAIGEVRRLQLAAEAGGALVLLVRPAGDIGRTSSAASRWSLERLPHTELAEHGARVVGWRVELRRRRRVGA
jgi:hypothetical protein